VTITEITFLNPRGKPVLLQASLVLKENAQILSSVFLA
jgi:hypothetical protein